MDLNIILIITIVLLQFVDFYTTYKALKIKGIVEANTIMRYLFSKFGVVPVLTLKVLLVAAVVVSMNSVENIIVTIAYILIAILYAFVAYSNVLVIASKK